MAQTAPSLPGEGMPRPIPRGSRPLRSRDTRPRFQALDAVWMLLPAILFAGLSFPAWNHQPLGTACLLTSVGTVVLTYLLGWRAAGRPAGVIAGLLLATSGTFAVASSLSLTQDIATLLTLAALFAFVAGSSLAALALAAALVWVRPDCVVLLGPLLLTFTVVQQRKRAWLGAALFLIPTVSGAIYALTGGHGRMFQVTPGFHTELWAWLVAPATLFVSWFLLPFFGEMADPVRRARWLPVVLWAAVYALLASALTVGHSNRAAVLMPFLPLWFLFAGAGLARLLPMMTGDLPNPALRYVVATLAVLSLVAVLARVEWPARHESSVKPSARAAAPPVPALTPPLTVVPMRTVAGPKPRPAPHKPATAPHALAANEPVKNAPVKHKAVKPAVRLYAVKNGRLVRRSKWAIQWDMTHPHP